MVVDISSSRVSAAGRVSAPAALDAKRSLTGAMVLSVLLGIFLLGLMIWAGGYWGFIATTRLLDPLIEGGFVQYHDLGPGFLPGLPEVGYYYMSQDPIDWRLVVIAAGFMALYPLIKAVQFHKLAVAYGSRGSFGGHLRAYFYSDGLDRFLPFAVGRVARAEILAKTGMDPKRARDVVVVQQAFTIFEITVYALIGLSLLGWVDWFSQLFWAVVCLGVAYFIVATRTRDSELALPWQFSGALSALVTLAQHRPGLLVQLCGLSLLAFGVLDIATYITMTAFDTAVVLINVERSVLLTAIVGGYIAARLVPVTPGGIGQWELGFATGLTLGGADVSMALIVIGLLANLLRILTGLVLMGISMMRYELPTNLRQVWSTFMSRVEPEADPAYAPENPMPARTRATSAGAAE